MKVEFYLGTGLVGGERTEVIELPDDYTEDDIEAEYQEWVHNFLDKSWHILEGDNDVD